MSKGDDEFSMTVGSGIGCLGMCVLAAFVFWMCTGFAGCHNAGGWFKEAPKEVHIYHDKPEGGK